MIYQWLIKAIVNTEKTIAVGSWLREIYGIIEKRAEPKQKHTIPQWTSNSPNYRKHQFATIPALIWGYIFYLKNPYKRSVIFYAFFLGATAVFPILFYKYLWQFFPWINAFRYTQTFEANIIGISHFTVPLSIILTFSLVGVIEEFMKHISVRAMGKDEFQDIDDIIELSILCALGFSFTENIMYFHNIWVHQGAQNLLIPFIFRSIFSTFAHVLFSGVMGYYYALAHFATPILRQQKKIIWPRLMEKFCGIDDELIYAIQNLVQGFIIAAGLHALFNVLLEMNWTMLIVPFLLQLRLSGFI